MSWTPSQPESNAWLEDGCGQSHPPNLFSADANNSFHVLWGDGERVFCRVERHADGDLPGVLAVTRDHDEQILTVNDWGEDLARALKAV